jgi:hypothetical protein
MKSTSLRLLLCGIGAAGFAMSLYLHVCCRLGQDMEPYLPWVYGLFGSMVAVWVPAIITARMRSTGVGKGLPLTERKQAQLKAFIGLMPIPAWVLVVCISSYGTICMMMSMEGLSAGVPSFVDGQYQINSHGKVTVVTEAAYHAARAALVELFSSVWMVFHGIGALMLFPFKPRHSASQG